MDPSGSSESDEDTIPSLDLLNGNKSDGHPSSSHLKETLEDELEDFRDKWQKELQISSKSSRHSVEIGDGTSKEDKARGFYLMAADMEKTGKMYEAVKLYKKAFDLVPDYKHREVLKKSNNSRESKEGTNSNKSANINKIYKEGDLLRKLKCKVSRPLCFPKNEQHTTTHISCLPFEVILYILKWVVSQDLDMRSLEMFGRVCRGFYICARDTEIWKLACYKVWGHNSKLDGYISWRQMFLERPRLLFNGCYISKTTYIRHGENSFQDQFYRPWHLITYYRYFRFFPDGKVLVLTTPDEPNMCLSQLKNRTSKSPVLSGNYLLKDDRVIISVYRQENKNHQTFKRNTRRELQQLVEQTFEMELKITNHKNKKHIQLQWTHYSIRTKSRGVENVCDFDLANTKFPPLWFSRVKSFALESEFPLS